MQREGDGDKGEGKGGEMTELEMDGYYPMLRQDETYLSLKRREA